MIKIRPARPLSCQPILEQFWFVPWDILRSFIVQYLFGFKDVSLSQEVIQNISCNPKRSSFITFFFNSCMTRGPWSSRSSNWSRLLVEIANWGANPIYYVVCKCICYKYGGSITQYQVKFSKELTRSNGQTHVSHYQSPKFSGSLRLPRGAVYERLIYYKVNNQLWHLYDVYVWLVGRCR